MSPFDETYAGLARMLIDADPVNVGEVHAQKTDDPNWISRELRNLILEYPIPSRAGELAVEVGPNLPWAEDHFQERVSGVPYNPPPSHQHWPYARRGNEEHLIGGKFSHTYPERMWPKRVHEESLTLRKGMKGIRFDYGDLNDLIIVLAKNPYSRQAYLPIWFPEDLDAAVHGERVPCTLGYHFLLRNGKLNITYFIRSCDLVRFFRDDVYMACRLCLWVIDELKRAHDPKTGVYEGHLWEEVNPGNLILHVVSLHCFEGDLPMLRKRYASAT